MPFHDITELPTGICDPNTALLDELSADDRMQITELLHRIYLCEDSRDHTSLGRILTEDYVNEHPLFGRHESASRFLEWLQNTPAGFDGIRHHCLNAVTRSKGTDTAESVSYILVTQLFPATSRDETPSETMDSKLPRIIGHGVVVDRWIRRDKRWYLRHRSYQQMSVNSSFLSDREKRDAAAEIP